MIFDQIIALFNQTVFRIITALLIFLFGFILGKILERVVYKILKELEINEFIKSATGAKINADHLISIILSYSLYFISLIAALEEIGLANIVLYMLAGAIMMVILLSFFLAIRDFIPNVISGIYLYRKDLPLGSTITVNNITGKLVSIDLLQTKIEAKGGDILYIPNSTVAKSEIRVKK